MLEIIQRIASSVDVPVTADIERGYADSPDGVAANVREVLDTGVAGINIEDSIESRGAMRSTADQCDRIRAVREAADRDGVPLVINARTDVWICQPNESPQARTDEIIERGRAYIDAGADCIYPVVLGDVEILGTILAATKAPLNVYAAPDAASMQELEEAGISRLSLGPGLIKAVLRTMKTVALGLKTYESYDVFTDNAMQAPEILEFVRKERES